MAPYLNFLAVAGLALSFRDPTPSSSFGPHSPTAPGPGRGPRRARPPATWSGEARPCSGWPALLAASGTAFSALKLLGAAYLLLLGAQALLAAARGDRLAPEDAERVPASRAAAFRRGLASDLFNVKVGLFWTALVPQFVSADTSALLPVAMVVSMTVMVFAWLAGYAHLAGRLSRTLRRSGTSRAVNGTVGTMLVALGARLGLAH